MSQEQWSEPSYEPYEPGETPRELRRQGDVVRRPDEVPAASTVPSESASAPAPVDRGRSFVDGLPIQAFLVPSTICVLIYLMTDAGGYFWPMWVMLGTGMPLLLTLIGRFSRD